MNGLGGSRQLPHIFFPLLGDEDSEFDVPAVLRALQPLMAPLSALELDCARWGVERVKALGEVLPRTCTLVVLLSGSISREALEDAARSLHWVQRLELERPEVSPEDLVTFVCLARRVKEEGAGALRLEEVLVSRPVCREGVDEEEHKRVWEQAVREVQAEGAGMVLRLAW